MISLQDKAGKEQPAECKQQWANKQSLGQELICKGLVTKIKALAMIPEFYEIVIMPLEMYVLPVKGWASTNKCLFTAPVLVQPWWQHYDNSVAFH